MFGPFETKKDLRRQIEILQHHVFALQHQDPVWRDLRMLSPQKPIRVDLSYANNVMVHAVVKFVIPGEKWSEFEASQTYRQLVEDVRSLQTPDTQI